jgi:hypothetical protein
MGRPQLPIWKEFATTVASSDEKRAPDVACLHCREQVRNARPANLLRHALNCAEMPDDVRLRITSVRPQVPAQLVTRVELEAAMAGQQQQNQSDAHSEDGQEGETEAAAAPTTIATSRPVLGKRPRAALPSSSDNGQDHLERVLTSIRDVMAGSLDCKRQELQLRRDELEFQKEALATKMEDRRQARDEERRDRREQREADRQERLELARIENEKNLAFLKAVMESSAQRRT